MNHILLTISILLLTLLTTHAQNTQASSRQTQTAAATKTAQAPITGTWSGPIMGIKLVFHFTQSPTGEVQGTMDSPQQNAMGLSIGQTIIKGDTVTCILSAPAASYTAIRTDDTTLTGTWHQNGGSFPLIIHRTSTSPETTGKTETQAEVPRPQTPHPPFPYHSDSVQYDNADRPVHLGAPLPYPEQGGPFPAAILITGSGIQDRDENLFGHRSFAVIADYLTRQGYAVLRVDDRSAGLSTGDVYHATSLDFAKDVETSFDWLKKQKQINPKKIGLIGHSEGGIIAPIVAAQNKDIAFIINLAGPFDGYQTLMYQTAEPLRRSHTGQEMINFALAKERMLLDNMETTTDSASFMQGLTRDYNSYYASVSDSSHKTQYAFVPKPRIFLGAIAPMAHSLVSPWWKYLANINMRSTYKNVKCPVLLVGGDKDIQVPNASAMDSIATILKDNKNNKVETHLMPGLNHLFQHCHTCSIQEYAKLEETFAPEVLKIMADWLDKNIPK